MIQRSGTRRGLVVAAALLGATLVCRELLQRRGVASLEGAVALVTGGSRGLGFLLARELVREGCRIAICARDAVELERASRDLAREGTEVVALVCDVSDRAQVERMVAEATRRLGPVDILVNNAGIIQVGPIETMSLSDFEQSMGTMFWGTVYPTLALLPDMLRRQSGRIVNITSIAGKVSVPHLLPYDCAKYAAVGFSEGLRAELNGRGVTVTTIVPGLMRTGSFLNALFKGQHDKEFTWFALGASLPFISMDAERAARQIVQALKRGSPVRILSVPANVLARFHGLMPGTSASVINRLGRLLLPPAPPGDGRDLLPGKRILEAMDGALLRWLTGWGLSAARRFHELPPPEVGPYGTRTSETV